MKNKIDKVCIVKKILKNINRYRNFLSTLNILIKPKIEKRYAIYFICMLYNSVLYKKLLTNNKKIIKKLYKLKLLLLKLNIITYLNSLNKSRMEKVNKLKH